MAQKKKKRSLFDRMAFGSEKSEGYARSTLPSNRWELGWDIFKGSFGRLIIVNLLVLLFFIPLFLLLFYRYGVLVNLGSTYPFMQGFGGGYQAPISVNGMPENIILTVNMLTYLFLPIAAMIAAVGVSGGAYVIRNMVWTEGIFVANDFWRGIKQNIKTMLIIALVYSLVFYLNSISIAMLDQLIATNANPKWLFIVMKILTIIILVYFSVMTLHMITMSVTYDLKYRHLFKNSFMFTLGMLPHNVFFIAMGMVPVIFLLLGGIFMIIGIILMLLFGFSLFLLVWTNFCQWSYDKFINDKIEGAKKNRGIYEKIKESDSEALRQYRESLAVVSKNSLNSRPIKPITDDELKVVELPTSFTRADLEKLRESKQAIYDDHARYVEEHKNDPEFQPTEADKKLEEEELEKQKRIEKAKKALEKRNKK